MGARRYHDAEVCPADHQSLQLQDSMREGSEILTGTMKCPSGHSFPITNGVPRLLSPDALATAAKLTQDSFSAKWKRIPSFGHEEASRRMYVDSA